MLALSHLQLIESKSIEWKKSKTALVLIFSLLIPCTAQNEVCFEIEENPNINDFALSIFQKYVNVLGGIHIYALESISDEKVLHVAAVAAELLDNNEDGFIDDPIIGNYLKLAGISTLNLAPNTLVPLGLVALIYSLYIEKE